MPPGIRFLEAMFSEVTFLEERFLEETFPEERLVEASFPRGEFLVVAEGSTILVKLTVGAAITKQQPACAKEERGNKNNN